MAIYWGEPTWTSDIQSLKPCEGDGITPLKLPPIKIPKAEYAETPRKLARFIERVKK